MVHLGVTILVDPWLTGELTFYGQTWAFVGRKGELPPVDVDAIAAKADLIVLTQVALRIRKPSNCIDAKCTKRKAQATLPALQASSLPGLQT